MTGKQATMILLDMGKSMQSNFGASPNQKRMDVAVNCIKLMLQQKMFNSKTHEIGLILFGLLEAGGDKIRYIRGLGRPDVDFLKNVSDLRNFESDDTFGGDIFEALDSTIETIQDFVGKKSYDKKIFLMTAGYGKTMFLIKQVQELGVRAREMGIKINVIGFDFLKRYNPNNEDQEYELQNLEQNDPQQAAQQNVNQKLLGILKQSVKEKMQLFPSNIAIQLYEQFRTKQVNLRSKFSGKLDIAPNISIDIQLYTKTTEEKLPGLKAYSLAVGFNSKVEDGKLVREVGMCISEDPNMTPIDQKKAIKAYYYGKKLIPISETLQKQMIYGSPRELKLLGFVDKKLIPRYSFSSGVDIMIASQNETKSDIKSKKIFAALCHSMKQLNKAAVVRYVWRSNGSPKLCVLIPQIGKSYECFYMVQIPTSESVRDFQFNPLKESSQLQQQVISDLIDKMDLMKTGEDNNDEALQIKYTFNPTRQYFYQTVFHKVFEQHGPIPQLDQNIKNYIQPEKQLIKNAEAELHRMKDAFKLEIVEEEQDKQLSKKVFWRQLISNNNTSKEVKNKNVNIKMEAESENQEEIVGVVEEAALIQKKFSFDDNKKDDIVRQVTQFSPEDDFIKMISNKKEDLVQDAMKQMKDLIQSLVETSIRGSNFDKAIHCLKALRRGCTQEFEQVEAPNFNEFLYALKNKYLKTKENCAFWKQAIQQGITLITAVESKKSEVQAIDAVRFLEVEEEVVQDIPAIREEVQNYDIMDELE